MNHFSQALSISNTENDALGHLIATWSVFCIIKKLYGQHLVQICVRQNKNKASVLARSYDRVCLWEAVNRSLKSGVF